MNIMESRRKKLTDYLINGCYSNVTITLIFTERKCICPGRDRREREMPLDQIIIFSFVQETKSTRTNLYKRC